MASITSTHTLQSIQTSTHAQINADKRQRERQTECRKRGGGGGGGGERDPPPPPQHTPDKYRSSKESLSILRNQKVVNKDGCERL